MKTIKARTNEDHAAAHLVAGELALRGKSPQVIERTETNGPDVTVTIDGEEYSIRAKWGERINDPARGGTVICASWWADGSGKAFDTVGPVDSDFVAIVCQDKPGRLGSYQSVYLIPTFIVRQEIVRCNAQRNGSRPVYLHAQGTADAEPATDKWSEYRDAWGNLGLSAMPEAA